MVKTVIAPYSNHSRCSQELALSSTHARTQHARTHGQARTHARTHARSSTHARTHARTLKHARTHARTVKHARTHGRTVARSLIRTQALTQVHTHARAGAEAVSSR
eukprot:1079049-Pleurochrysis_carterae.AAC.1